MNMKATKIPVELYIILYGLVLTTESVEEIIKCDHSTECHCK